jgi:hypothetical protein
MPTRPWRPVLGRQPPGRSTLSVPADSEVGDVGNEASREVPLRRRSLRPPRRPSGSFPDTRSAYRVQEPRRGGWFASPLRRMPSGVEVNTPTSAGALRAAAGYEDQSLLTERLGADDGFASPQRRRSLFQDGPMLNREPEVKSGRSGVRVSRRARAVRRGLATSQPIRATAAPRASPAATSWG